MIIELKQLNKSEIPDNSVIIFKNNEFRCIPKDELIKSYNDKIVQYEVAIDRLEKRLAAIEKLNLEHEIEKINDSKIKNAFLLMVTDIEEGVIDTPEDYDSIKKWVLQPTQEIPELLKGYIKE